jgi:hypothetical protein|tara:strand:+ start:379 stop:1161 length:783 start_codon:yes stop_codon:yes gene_type:complete
MFKVYKKILVLVAVVASLVTPIQLSAETKQTITIINNGKAGGSFNARTLMYKEGLVAAGYDVNYENIGKISQAVKTFKNASTPTIMVFATNMVYRQDLFHTEENFIMLEYQQPLWICKSNEAKGELGNMKVAHGKTYNPQLLKNILGKDIVLVPYKNSGAMLKGMLGGDVDIMVNNQGKSLKYLASGKGTCTPSDSLPIMQATVIGKNVDVKKIRRVIYDISMDIKFIEYHNTRKLQRPSSTWLNELSEVQTLEKAWKVD